MKNFFNSCKRCLNPWVVCLIVIAIIALIIFVPIVGIGALIVALPLIGCTVMCGGMAFMMMKSPKKKG